MTNEELKFANGQDDETDGSNGGMLVLAEAVLGGSEEGHLSLEETGAAEELLALASEASLSSPINRESIQTPLETENIPPSNQNAQPMSAATTGARKHVCNNCAATSTPFWRKSSDGLYYCNACGLYLRTHNAMRPLSLSKNRESRRGKMRPELCGNCGATDTPMWRKTEDGMVVCNACGLYHKLHGQHRRIGSKRTAVTTDKGEDSQSKKQVRSNDFTLVRENAQIATAVKPSSLSSGGASVAKYSLDNQYHHKFDPTRVSNQHTSPQAPGLPASGVFPVVEVQPVDSRKLAYLKSSQGRTALLAPKLPLQEQPLPALPQPQATYTPNQFVVSPPPMPPILANFINSLASTSPDNLTVDQVEHPLQPLLTSIVSQKLKEQKSKHMRKSSTSPILQTSANIPMQIYQHQMQLQQQQQSQEETWPSSNQLAEFIQNQQQAIYNQQMIQQAIYNDNDARYQNDYNNNTNGGYANYQVQVPIQFIQQQQHQQQVNEPRYYANNQQHYTLNNQVQYNVAGQPQQYIVNEQYILQQQQQQQPQLVQMQYAMPSQPQNILLPQYHYHHTQEASLTNDQQHQEQQPQQQQTVYYTEQYTEPPLRQLSPFSGIKFDKNLIELVNMQFWQDGTTASSNQENSSSDQNNNPF